MAQKKRRAGALNERVLRDTVVARAIKIAESFVDTSGFKVTTILNGGGVHVGPPHGMPPRGHSKGKRAAPGFGFSFKLPISAEDDACLEQVFDTLIGGGRETFDPNGNEWGSGQP